MDRSPERDSDRPRDGKLDRDRHKNPRERQIHAQWLKERQKGRQAQEKEHYLSIQESKAGTGTWKGGCARNRAEISSLLG